MQLAARRPTYLAGHMATYGGCTQGNRKLAWARAPWYVLLVSLSTLPECREWHNQLSTLLYQGSLPQMSDQSSFPTRDLSNTHTEPVSRGRDSEKDATALYTLNQKAQGHAHLCRTPRQRPVRHLRWSH